VPDPLRVVIVTTFDLDEYVYGALQAGAVGFVLKGASPALLSEAVRAAHAGDAFISPQVTLRLLRHLAPRPKPPADLWYRCRSAKVEVVLAIAKGRTNTERCRRAVHLPQHGQVLLGLASIRCKLGVRNRVEIAALA
jgi:DNA-binding NarL/FixJ family response regulator